MLSRYEDIIEILLYFFVSVFVDGIFQPHTLTILCSTADLKYNTPS